MDHPAATMSPDTNSSFAGAMISAFGSPWSHRGHESRWCSRDADATSARCRCCRVGADPKHLGARIGITSVLHSWGSAMTHHPHVHMIVPGGGLAMDDSRWISCKPNFLLPVRVLSELFRRLMLEKLLAAHAAGRLQCFRLTRLSGRCQGVRGIPRPRSA